MIANNRVNGSLEKRVTPEEPSSDRHLKWMPVTLGAFLFIGVALGLQFSKSETQEKDRAAQFILEQQRDLLRDEELRKRKAELERVDAELQKARTDLARLQTMVEALIRSAGTLTGAAPAKAPLTIDETLQRLNHAVSRMQKLRQAQDP